MLDFISLLPFLAVVEVLPLGSDAQCPGAVCHHRPFSVTVPGGTLLGLMVPEVAMGCLGHGEKGGSSGSLGLFHTEL